MANISGVIAGLRAGSTKARAPVQRKAKTISITHCTVCGGALTSLSNASRKRGTVFHEDGVCQFCCMIFGLRDFGRSGATNTSPEEARQKIEKLRELQYGIVLRAGSFYDHSVGSLSIEPGDIFKIHRAGLSTQSAGSDGVMELCSRTRSKECCTVDIMVGPCKLTLWPHEISAISFFVVMELKRAGEIEESYVAQEDETGYFCPRPDLRELIYQTFGPLVQ